MMQHHIAHLLVELFTSEFHRRTYHPIANHTVVPEFLRTLVFARPRGDDQFADCTFSPSLDMSR